jgi:hypothetical protein
MLCRISSRRQLCTDDANFRTTVRMADNCFFRDTNEDAVLDDSSGLAQAACQRFGIGNCLELAIKDVVAAIGHQRVIEAAPQTNRDIFKARISKDPLKMLFGTSPAESNHLNRERESSKLSDKFSFINDRNHFFGSACDNLFPKKTGTSPLDHAAAIINLIGAVDCQVERGDIVQVRDRDSDFASDVSCSARCRDADYFQAFFYSFTQDPDKPMRC